MKNTFESGHFNGYRVVNLRSAQGNPKLCPGGKTTIFLSHKHDDLNDLYGVIGFLEKEYDVKCYIDGLDPSMPKVTSAETAKKIKDRIRTCRKFILMATSGAVESKWCNWELGYGDALRYEKDEIAILPIRMKLEAEKDFKGNEYMDLYPTIVFRDGTTTYDSGSPINRGYYVRRKTGSGYYSLTPLKEWLSR